MALIKCSECGAEISDKATHCPKCGAPIVINQISNEIPADYADGDSPQTSTITPKRKSSSAPAIYAILFILIVIYNIYQMLPKSYYVAQVTGGISNNGIGYIDSSIHSDKSCCQKVVEAWNSEPSQQYPAKIIKVKLDDTAYKNSFGQSVSYDAALYDCPYCFKY